MATGNDWSRPPRQVPGTSYWYAHTDQWRYDAYGAEKLATPLGAADSTVGTPWTSWPRPRPWAGARSIRSSTALRWMWPTRPLPPVATPVTTSPRLASGELRLAVTDPDDPANWPRVLTVWRANLIGASGKGGEYFLKHLLGTDASVIGAPPAGGSNRRMCAGTATFPRANSTC